MFLIADRLLLSRKIALGAVMALAAASGFSGAALGQSSVQDDSGSKNADRTRILLVLPFDNRTGQPSLDWVREAASSLLSSRFASAGFSPMSRADRMYALDHLGLPEGFQPSRASALKLAQTLDADDIIVGSYITDGNDLIAEARVVDVPHLRMGLPVTARGEMHSLIDIFDGLAWQLTRQMDPHFSLGEDTFIAAGKGIRLDAFEQYIRGITEADQAERLRHLKQSVVLSPDFAPAWMALGREEYSSQQYEDAAAAFARVGGSSPDALEADFYRGLSLLFSGRYPQAQESFSAVARELPLAEVLNNEGVALSRQGKDASGIFRQAIGADNSNPDYHFNLGVSLMRHQDTAGAIAEMTQCLKMRPSDGEAQTLLRTWKQGPPAAPSQSQSADSDHSDPLERIERRFDAAAFRQAAGMMEQMEAARMAALAPRDRAAKLATQGQDYLDRGLILEAERLYQSAEETDGSLAAAHLGLARVRQRVGDLASARKEADTALQIDPGNKAAQDLSRQLASTPEQKQ
jgi:tetratricopeptide (TPR) repeat protein